MTTKSLEMINQYCASHGVTAQSVEVQVQKILLEIDSQPYPNGLERYLGFVTMPAKAILFAMATDDNEACMRDYHWGIDEIAKFDSLFQDEVFPKLR